jgi:hypothetical protein
MRICGKNNPIKMKRIYLLVAIFASLFTNSLFLVFDVVICNDGPMDWPVTFVEELINAKTAQK